MSLTVGIPVYNEEKTLIRTLDSVVDSCWGLDANIVLCFNGTTDNGRDIAKNYPFPLEIITSSKGKPSAVKKISEYSKSDIIIFVDADVVVDKDCFSSIYNAFNDGIMAVAGRPIPYKSNNIVYNIINARMSNPDLEVSLDGSPKEFLHGRIYGVRKSILDDVNKNFAKGIGDDTFLSHYILLNYGRDAIAHVNDANVFYQPVTSINSWWRKWSRIWQDLDNLYKDNPEFLLVKTATKIDWNNMPLSLAPYFVAERIIHHIGRTYFNIIKNYKNIEWIRLDDTKELK